MIGVFVIVAFCVLLTLGRCCFWICFGVLRAFSSCNCIVLTIFDVVYNSDGNVLTHTHTRRRVLTRTSQINYSFPIQSVEVHPVLWAFYIQIGSCDAILDCNANIKLHNATVSIVFPNNITSSTNVSKNQCKMCSTQTQVMFRRSIISSD